jgi:hypothetical protein
MSSNTQGHPIWNQNVPPPTDRMQPTGIGPVTTNETAARLVKTGGPLVKQARYYWLLLA